MPQHKCYVFAGPSLGAVAAANMKSHADTLRPPAKREDVARLIGSRPRGIIVLADGQFHQSMSVGHAELREAARRGWSVWGVSSIGAIRAYELRDAGMHGFGRVYQLFFRFHDFQDDEVALLHDSEPPYTPASEPLVHLRFALAMLVRHGTLKPCDALTILRLLKSMWYGDRTLALFQEMALEFAKRRARPAIVRVMRRFDRFRVKERDLAALLAARPWSVSSRVRS
jgi:hypothetical protein